MLDSLWPLLLLLAILAGIFFIIRYCFMKSTRGPAEKEGMRKGLLVALNDSVVNKRGVYMRKCLRCEADMIENLKLVSDIGSTLEVKKKGILKESVGNIMCAVCPQCGYVETYIDSHRKLENI